MAFRNSDNCRFTISKVYTMAIQKIEVDRDGNVDIYLRLLGDWGLERFRNFFPKPSTASRMS